MKIDDTVTFTTPKGTQLTGVVHALDDDECGTTAIVFIDEGSAFAVYRVNPDTLTQI